MIKEKEVDNKNKNLTPEEEKLEEIEKALEWCIEHPFIFSLVLIVAFYFFTDFPDCCFILSKL